MTSFVARPITGRHRSADLSAGTRLVRRVIVRCLVHDVKSFQQHEVTFRPSRVLDYARNQRKMEIITVSHLE